ncbi:MAG: SMP-30/gluconolactonase/LRE family protein [Polyangiaceae bacterium]|jgi:sugar lactone lactonase YvrE
MKRAFSMHLVAAGIFAVTTPAAASQPPVGTISPFTGNISATACDSPEGLAIDFQGNFYTGSSQTKPTGAVCQFSPEGTLKKTFSIPAGPSGFVSLLGVLFEGPHTLYALDFADDFGHPTYNNGRVLALDLDSEAVTTVADGFTFPNGIAEDLQGNYYVADSLQGSVTRISADGSRKTSWSTSSLLAPGTGFPPLGANGIAFDLFFRNVYVSNTSNDQIIRIPVLPDGSAGTAEVFADGATIDEKQNTTLALAGADGIAFDILGNLYVMCNQANQVQVISPDGRLTAQYASTTLPLDNPASLVFVGNQLFCTNASIFDGGLSSALFVLQAPFPGLPPL